jgi:sulfoxide reductase catalytic subunit YedY
MIPHFTKTQKAIHYPDDRRAYLGIKPYMIVILLALILGSVGAAWFQYLLFGLPHDPSSDFVAAKLGDPSGFPLWVSLSHWVNFFFLMLIIRSGLSILADHPRLYWNNSCKSKSNWIHFTPVKIPLDRDYRPN